MFFTVTVIVVWLHAVYKYLYFDAFIRYLCLTHIDLLIILVIEFLPAELKSRLQQIKEIDENVQGIALVGMYI